MITESLLRDRDLQIENNHRRGDYRSFFPGDLRPDFLARGQNGRIYLRSTRPDYRRSCCLRMPPQAIWVRWRLCA